MMLYLTLKLMKFKLNTTSIELRMMRELLGRKSRTMLSSRILDMAVKKTHCSKSTSDLDNKMKESLNKQKTNIKGQGGLETMKPI